MRIDPRINFWTPMIGKAHENFDWCFTIGIEVRDEAVHVHFVKTDPGWRRCPNIISLYSRITKINYGQTFRKNMPQEIPGYIPLPWYKTLWNLTSSINLCAVPPALFLGSPASAVTGWRNT